jgi:hypothetical protein
MKTNQNSRRTNHNDDLPQILTPVKNERIPGIHQLNLNRRVVIKNVEIGMKKA